MKTPSIGMSGVFTLRTPFTIPDNVIYTVEGHRSFSELIGDGIDPVEVVYAPVGLGIDEYQVDAVQPGALVIILINTKGDRVLVPNTYIDEYPNTSVVPHAWMVATISMGVLPIDYDFQRIKEAVASTVSDYIGVEPNVYIAQKRTHDVITEERAQELAAIRNAAIQYRSTARADKLALQATVEQQKQQIDDLLRIIEDLQNP